MLAGRTPYEAYKGKKLNLEYIRVFICVAYMKLKGIHTTKLDDRSKTVVHLGNRAQKHISCMTLKSIHYM